jgi:D-amino-acid oxidase
METLNELWDYGQKKPQPQPSLVEIMTAVYLHNDNTHLTSQTHDTNVTYPDPAKIPAWTKDPRLEFQQLTVEMLAWQNTVKKLRIPTEDELKQAGYWHAWMFQAPVVDSPKMLEVRMDSIIDFRGCCRKQTCIFSPQVLGPYYE